MSNIMRNKFTQLLRAAAIVAVGTFAGACGDDGGTAIDAPPAIDAPAGCTASNATVMIATNHVHSPHALVVTSADVAAGVDKTFDIMGTSGHTHLIMVTAADFTMLKAGGTITVTSTEAETHTHVVTISCA